MKWNIICDSSCDITDLKHLAEDTRFSVAPLKIVVGDKEYVDTDGIDCDEMLSAMARYKGASSSSCPSPADWAAEYEKAENSIAICISRNLSGAYNSALAAKDMVLAQNPDKKIHVINSCATSGVMILLAIKVNTLIKEGRSFEEVVARTERYRDTLELTFCLKNYDNLIKAGRMNPFLGAVAGVLGIRAVAKKSPQGMIDMLAKQRGDMAAYRYIVNQMASLKDLKNCRIIISHCKNFEGAARIKSLLIDLYKAENVQIIPTRGLCSYYANEGGLIISY